MVYEMLNFFNKLSVEELIKCISDNHELPEGLYFIIKNKNIEKYVAKKEKEEIKVYKISETLEETEINDDEKKGLVKKYFYSIYLSSNKAIKNKNIFSNNIYSYIFKMVNIFHKDEEILIEDIKNIYGKKYSDFDKIKELKAFKENEENKEANEANEFNETDKSSNKTTKDCLNISNITEYLDKFSELYKDEIHHVEKEEIKNNIYTNSLLKEIYEFFIKYNIEDIIEAKNSKFENNRICIYIDVEESKYKEKWLKYINLRIFNNEENEDSLYGINGFSFALDNKKPFLKMRNTKFKDSPFIIKREDAIKLYLIEFIIKSLKNIFYIQYDSEESFSLVDNIKERIEDLDDSISICVISKVSDNAKIKITNFSKIQNFKKNKIQIEIKNYLDINDFKEESIFLDSFLNDLFNEKLTTNYFTLKTKESEKIKIDKEINFKITNYMYKYRQTIFNYIYKKYKEQNDIDKFIYFMDNIVFEIIKEHLKSLKYNYYKGRLLFNKYLNVLDVVKNSKGDKRLMNKKIKDYYERINKELEENDFYEIENDEDLFYLYGQLAYYLCKQAESDREQQLLYNRFLNIKSIEQLDNEIKKIHKKYSYKIFLNHKKLNKLVSAINNYKYETNFNEKIFFVGFFSENILFNKKNKEEGDIINEK